MIKGEFVEVRDRLSPAALSGIRRKHTFTVTMSTHHIDEEWTDSDMRLKMFGKRNPKITRQDSDSATIGDASQHVVWHVLGPRKLQRIFAGQHYLMTIEIEVSESNACRPDVRYLKQVGIVSITLEQPNGTMAEFSLPQGENASGTIEMNSTRKQPPARTGGRRQRGRRPPVFMIAWRSPPARARS